MMIIFQHQKIGLPDKDIDSNINISKYLKPSIIQVIVM